MANRNLFNSIALQRPKRNHFDLTHDVKLSFNMGELVPIMFMDCVPGDNVKIGCESLLRFAPLVSPVMHRMSVTMHYFFVPYRILWENWENWIIQKEGSAGTFPVVTWNYADNGGRLGDYLGLPYNNSAVLVNALPFAAYQKVYDEYYRDQNAIVATTPALTNGNNDTNTDLFTLRIRAWQHDYFTAALPFAQAGPPVMIPMSGDVALKPGANVAGQHVQSVGHAPLTGALSSAAGSEQVGGVNSVYDPNGSLEVENATSTINDLRRAYRLQEWLEKNMRAGRRYVETILAHFGVKSDDARLQRPEYITGTKSPVMISEILNTTGTDTLPQGNMAGHGISVTSGGYGGYSVKEHGCIIGIMSVLPETAYQQGIDKFWLKTVDPFEFFWPEFAHIGEQEVQNRELYADHSAPADTFGYVPRYAEYKYMSNRVAGDFRTTLNFWHLGRIFASEPNLNKEFIECVPSMRVFAVTDTDVQHMYAHVLNKVTAIRPMPKFGTPSF